MEVCRWLDSYNAAYGVGIKGPDGKWICHGERDVLMIFWTGNEWLNSKGEFQHPEGWDIILRMVLCRLVPWPKVMFVTAINK